MPDRLDSLGLPTDR